MTNFEAHELEILRRKVKNNAFASGVLELAIQMKVTVGEFRRGCESVKDLLKFASDYATATELVEHIAGSLDEV